MNLMRHLIACLVIAFAIGVQGVASAASGLTHQTHCIDAMGAKADHSTEFHGEGHRHDDLASPDATSGHDHETCMIYAYPALSETGVRLGGAAGVFLAKLRWPEGSAHALESEDGPKRPPKA